MHRKFLRDWIICLVPCLVALWVVVNAYRKYEAGEGGFKLGVDLVGGTILIYEVDQERERQRRGLSKGGEDFSGAKTSQALAEAVKRRIDPDDVQNITVRPAGENRIEVILPTGSHRQNAAGKKDLNTGEVANIRKLIEQVGSLEFRIVANDFDDTKAFTAAETLFKNVSPDLLKALARGGDLPPPPTPLEGEEWLVKGRPAQYLWVELSRAERKELGLLNSMANDENKPEAALWRRMRDARANHEVVKFTPAEGNRWTKNGILLFSRECLNVNLSEKLRNEKKYEYFILTRVSDRVEVDGTRVTISATSDTDPTNNKPIVAFTFNSEGGRQFYEVTDRNKPEQEGRVTRNLAIILNGELISFPTLQAAISNRGSISGDFDQDYVNEIVKLLRSGALPATLKQKPVSENTIGPTLGADTIRSGTRAVGVAYLAVLLFMLFYYRFAGMVACIALLANLLLTVAFMVAVNATFTLPGLAGLVLMLGMAVDANILIYERLREERDRGANLIMSIRNAYDRAFPTIIDTHLSSIFTAIVLYTVGNDQLRGFGISLAVGLIISLFTSLFMTHLLFDTWQMKNWLRDLKMMRFLTKPKIDFMKLRKIMFPVTGVLTVLGLALFLLRGERGLNVDFVGGTVYGGQLKDEIDIAKLRDLMSEANQSKQLAVESVTRALDNSRGGNRDVYEVRYADGEVRRIELALGLAGATDEEKLADLKRRASHVPDWSVEQNFLSDATGDKSKYFTVRTTEKEPELVQASIVRLFKENNKDLLTRTKVGIEASATEPYTWTLAFSDPDTGTPQYASEAFIRTLLERDFRSALPKDKVILEPFRLQGLGEPKDGRFEKMQLSLSLDAQNVSSLDTKKDVLGKVAAEYEQRPQPERLETFDPTLAGDMRTRALVAIFASWVALLLYLWFRFGNWTFGLAAVLCLIHDLCFTLGLIGLSHYLYDTWVGKLLGLQDFKIDFATVAALLTLVGYSVNEIIVNFARLREVRGKNPVLTPQMINDSVNQTLSRTILTSTTTWLVVMVLYAFGGSGVHLFAFVMVVGVLIGTYSSIYVACPLLLMFGEGQARKTEGAAKKPAIAAPAPAAV